MFPKIFPSNRINYFMEWECVYRRPLYCSTPWMKVLVITGVPLMVKCWRILARQFSAPCPAQQQHQQGETQSEERIWPPQKKNGPLILALVSLGLPLGLEQIWFSAEHGSFCREGPWFPPRRGCVITGFSLDKETPLAGLLAGWFGASCLDTSPSRRSFNNAALKHASDMKEHHTDHTFLIKSFTWQFSLTDSILL